MQQELITIKATKKTRQALGLIAAISGKKHYEALEILLLEAIQKAGVIID